jgi:PIN domain nuclease of toxin-antitoxin system
VTQVLLDTHALVWWLEEKEKLSSKARAVISDPETVVFVSAASAWELAIKTRIGKFNCPQLVRNLSRAIQAEDFVELPISIAEALRAGSLRGAHSDPFDRMLVAQAQSKDIPVVSVDKCFDDYGVPRLW